MTLINVSNNKTVDVLQRLNVVDLMFSNL